MKRLFLILFLAGTVLNLNAQETWQEFQKLAGQKYSAKAYDESLEAISKAVELNLEEEEQDENLFFLATVIAYKADNYEKAAEYADDAISRNFLSKGSKFYQYSATAYKKMEKDSVEESVLRVGLERFPNSKSLKESLVENLLRKGTIHYNTGVENQKLANENLNDEIKYNEYLEKAAEEFTTAKGILEEAYSIKADNEILNKLLTTIYENLETPKDDRLVQAEVE